MYSKKRIFLTGILFLLLVALIAISWKFSSENSTQSNNVSMHIAEQIENHLNKYFDINRGDTFWKITFNELLRKAAHFCEYAVIGTVMCAMLNVAIRRVWPSALISVLVSPIFGLVDEYHQRFSPMRTPRLLDVCIDLAGIWTGIIIVTIFFLVFNYIKKLKRRIEELEKVR